MADADVIAAIIQDTGEVIEIDQPCIPKRLTQTGLLLPANLPFEKWQSVLERLQGMEFSVMWWLGDCLRYGERAYGEKYAQALDATDYAYQTIADAKWVAGRFEISRRRENLTWSHHREVAGIEDDAEQDAFLDAAETGGWSKKRLRSEVRRRNAARRGSINGSRTASANTEPLRGSPLPLPRRRAPRCPSSRRISIEWPLPEPPLARSTSINASRFSSNIPVRSTSRACNLI